MELVWKITERISNYFTAFSLGKKQKNKNGNWLRAEICNGAIGEIAFCDFSHRYSVEWVPKFRSKVLFQNIPPFFECGKQQFLTNAIKCTSSKRGKLYRWWKISDALIDQPEMARILRRNEGVSPVFFIIPPLPPGPRRAPIATPSPRFALGRCFSRGHCIRQATPLLCQASRDIEM